MAHLVETRRVMALLSAVVIGLALTACGGGGGGSSGDDQEWARETIAAQDFEDNATWNLMGNVDSSLPGSPVLWKANGALTYSYYAGTYDTFSKRNWGKAASPKYALDDARNVRLTFSCEYAIDAAETNLLYHDQRSVEIHLYRAGVAMTPVGSHRILLYPQGHPRAQATPLKPVDFQEMISCPGPMGARHVHEIDLEPLRVLYGMSSWDKVDLRVFFSFDSKDGMFNKGSGWTVDDFALTGEYLQ